MSHILMNIKIIRFLHISSSSPPNSTLLYSTLLQSNFIPPRLVDTAPSSSFSFGAAPAATGTFGAPAATGTFGAPAALGTFGAPAATGTFGAPAATGTFGAPAATGTFGAPAALGTFGAPAASGTFGGFGTGS